jgi:hypothetical protein
MRPALHGTPGGEGNWDGNRLAEKDGQNTNYNRFHNLSSAVDFCEIFPEVVRSTAVNLVVSSNSPSKSRTA